MADRRRSLSPTAEPSIRAGDPLLLRRSAQRVLDARAEVADLERHLGPRHVDLVRAKHRVAVSQQQYADQLEAELAFAAAWSVALSRLRPTATSTEIRAARTSAIVSNAELMKRGIVASDAPTTVLVPVLSIGELLRRRDELALDFGPKHPELVTVTQQLEQAREKLYAALADAATSVAPAVLDAELVARRAALAKEAQLLRRELASQLAR